MVWDRQYVDALLRGARAQVVPTPDPADDQAVLDGWGPPECSTSRVLVKVPEVIFDVNGYYRDLGVPHDATRKQLMVAYRDGGGPDDRRKTFVFTQLLNQATRLAYDRQPLGSEFVDAYTLERDRKRAQEARAAAYWRASQNDRQLSEEDADEIELQAFRDMGYRGARKKSDTPEQEVDPTPPPRQDGGPVFGYSYYRFRTRQGSDRQRLSRLAYWQSALVRELSEAGVSVRFAVGLHGMPHRWLFARVGYREVFLLSKALTDPPEIDEAAADAARQYASDVSAIPSRTN